MTYQIMWGITVILLLTGGVWMFQDALASILHYLKTENWHYNHALRVIRGLFGLAFIYWGIVLLVGG